MNSLEISNKMNVKVIGCIPTKSFQLTKYILKNLVKHFPNLVSKYIIKGVMDIGWARCLWKLKQTLGHKIHEDTVAIFINKRYIGTAVEFQEYLASKYSFTINCMPMDYKYLISTDIQNYYNNDELSFVRMHFVINSWEIGHVVFALFDKLIPKTCEYFKQLCLDKTKGYTNSYVHRIDVDNGFIQAGRICNTMAYLKKENYILNHDRRGVLSLASRDTYFNGPEFIISLKPNLWMNNKYVAFGHAVEGEKTLKTIEKLFAQHKNINQLVRITSCDVLINCTRPVIQTGLEAFLRSIIHKIVNKTIYIHNYGKPESLHMQLTNLQYMQLIVRNIMNNVMRKIEVNSFTQKSQKLRNLKAAKHSHTKSISNIQSSCNATEDKYNATTLRLHPNSSFNGNFREIMNPILRADRRMLVKSKYQNVNKISTKTYGINLPKNDKDYWKHKKIYDSIAK